MTFVNFLIPLTIQTPWSRIAGDLNERVNAFFDVKIKEWGEPCKRPSFCTLSNKNQASKWWFELEICSAHWWHVLCHHVFHEGCTWYGERGCFLRVVLHKEGSKAIAFVYKRATPKGLYSLLTGSTTTNEPNATLSSPVAGNSSLPSVSTSTAGYKITKGPFFFARGIQIENLPLDHEAILLYGFAPREFVTSRRLAESHTISKVLNETLDFDRINEDNPGHDMATDIQGLPGSKEVPLDVDTATSTIPQPPTLSTYSADQCGPQCKCIKAAHGNVPVRIDLDGSPHTELCFHDYYKAEGEQRWTSAAPSVPLSWFDPSVDRN